MKASAVPLHALPDETVRESLGYIVTNLREEDRMEVQASNGPEVEKSIIDAALWSELAWFLVDRSGLPVGVAGLVDSGVPGVGVPWMVGTPGLLKEKRALLVEGRKLVEEMHEHFPVLTNYIDARNTTSLDWLLHLGFGLVDAKSEYGPERRLFLQFSKGV